MDFSQSGQLPHQEAQFEGPPQGPFQQLYEEPQGQSFGNAQGHQAPQQDPPQWIAQFAQFMSQFTAQNTLNRSPEATVQSEEDQKRPRHTQPHPDKFSNEDNSRYPQFRSLLAAKLRIDAKAIGNEEERVWYGFGCLTDVAAGRIHPWIQYAQGTSEFTVEGLLKQTDQAFADPQKQAKALSKLNRIKQRNQDFRTYLQDFEQTLLEAQGWGWADEVKKGYLRAGLNRDLCDRLVALIEPDSYIEFTTQLRMISDKLQQLKAWDSSRNRGRGNNSRNSQVVENSMEWEPTQTTTVASVGRPQQRPPQRAKWVDHEEIGRRMSEGSCLRCGKQGHLIGRCPLLPAQNPNQRLQVQQASERRPKPKALSRKPPVAASTVPKSKPTAIAAAETLVEEIEDWETDVESEKE